MKTKIIIVDYGLGNIRSAINSIKKALEYKNIDATVERSSNYKSLKEATHVVLPGQGAFESCIQGLKKLDGIIEELNENIIIKKKPFLGICVGMQLLANQSFENGTHKGLGWVEGDIIKIPGEGLVLPHMGWNKIINSKKHSILKNIQAEHFYFVNSYYFQIKNKSFIISESKYGLEFPAIIACDNIIATQFHPEKSSKAGIELLSNFLLMQ